MSNNLEIQAANKRLVRDAFAAVDAHEFDRVREMMAEDCVCHMVNYPESMDREGTIEFIRAAYEIFPDFTHELQDVLADGDQVMVRLMNHTTHSKEFEGLPPTGKMINYASAHLLTIENGLIKEWWLLEDNYGFLSQLGMIMVSADKNA
jgi:steroid delta-isomerase-like uncharacterized protein